MALSTVPVFFTAFCSVCVGVASSLAFSARNLTVSSISFKMPFMASGLSARILRSCLPLAVCSETSRDDSSPGFCVLLLDGSHLRTLLNGKSSRGSPFAFSNLMPSAIIVILTGCCRPPGPTRATLWTIPVAMAATGRSSLRLCGTQGPQRPRASERACSRTIEHSRGENVQRLSWTFSSTKILKFEKYKIGNPLGAMRCRGPGRLCRPWTRTFESCTVRDGRP